MPICPMKFVLLSGFPSITRFSMDCEGENCAWWGFCSRANEEIIEIDENEYIDVIVMEEKE